MEVDLLSQQVKKKKRWVLLTGLLVLFGLAAAMALPQTGAMHSLPTVVAQAGEATWTPRATMTVPPATVAPTVTSLPSATPSPSPSPTCVPSETPAPSPSATEMASSTATPTQVNVLPSSGSSTVPQAAWMTLGLAAWLVGVLLMEGGRALRSRTSPPAR